MSGSNSSARSGEVNRLFSAGTLCELRRCAPHGSLPPCGGGTGRGVAIKHRPRSSSCVDLRYSSDDCVCVPRVGSRSSFLLYPSPCPSPTRGEGTLWHCSAKPSDQHSRKHVNSFAERGRFSARRPD